MPTGRGQGAVATGARLPDRRSPLPLWSQVSEDLRRRIDSGEFGDHFPGELALTEEYEVSRHTIREALRVLRSEGLVHSERGRASTVEARSFTQDIGSLYSLFNTLEEQGASHRNDVRRQMITRNPTVAATIGVPSTSDLVVIERLRFAHGVPLALDSAWMPADIAHPLLTSDLTTTGLYFHLERECGITVDSGQETITAMVPPAHVAELLEIPAQSAVHYIERIAFADDSPVEWRETYIRGDRFRLEVEWSRTTSTLSTSTMKESA